MNEQPADEPGLEIGFFGAFYPSNDNLGPTSTGLVRLLTEDPDVGHVTVFSQEGGTVPSDWLERRATVTPVWKPGDPLSLFRALVSMLKRRAKLDIYFFNIHLTVFGGSRLANFVGLTLAPTLRLLSHKPVFTYMHNLIETQELDKLGYHPTSLTRTIVKFLELIIARMTSMVVPLASQRQTASRVFGEHIDALFIPYVEGVNALDRRLLNGQAPDRLAARRDVTSPKEVVMFGFWGPQKDLVGALKVLEKLRSDGVRVHTTVIGKANTHFPSYVAELDSLAARLGGPDFDFRGEVGESELVESLLSSDLVILPYHATGGYSAVMNFAALFSSAILAYDLPVLRELSALVSPDCVFVSPESPSTLEDGIRRSLKYPPSDKEDLWNAIAVRRSDSKSSMRELVLRFRRAVASS